MEVGGKGGSGLLMSNSRGLDFSGFDRACGFSASLGFCFLRWEVKTRAWESGRAPGGEWPILNIDRSVLQIFLLVWFPEA